MTSKKLVGEFRPSQWLRSNRPEMFSDSRTVEEPQLTREQFEYHLETLTSRKQETLFETFARRLCEKEICPNLLPQTGPTGGGDSQVDSETYPVADSLAERWFEGVGRQASEERWGFAFSAKKSWQGKAKSDLKKIAASGRGYKLAYFVTNQHVADKKRASVEKELSKDAGFDVRILDRTWIVEKVFSNNRVNLAIEALGISASLKVGAEKGTLDTEREAQLKELDTDIADPDRYRGAPYQLVEDCLFAARLARNLEGPRDEIEGRFDRAERLAVNFGSRRQQLRIVYERAWTCFWWYEDYAEFNRLYPKVTELAEGTDQSADLELLCNMWQVLFGAVRAGKLGADAQLAERTKALKSDLDRLVADKRRPNNALEAQSSRLFIDLSEAINAGNEAAVDAVLESFLPILRKAEALGGFDVEQFQRLFETIGGILPRNTKYDRVLDALLEIVEKRRGEGENGRALVARGFQKLKSESTIDAIRYFGRALEKLIKREYRDELIRALFGCGLAYEQAGLYWAAWASFVAGAVTALADFAERGQITRPAVLAAQKLVWLELRLGRVPYLLCWAELGGLLGANLRMSQEERRSFNDERQDQDIALGLLLLGAPMGQLSQMPMLPAALEDLGLFLSRMGLLYAMGCEELLRTEGSIPSDQSAEQVRKFFYDWLGQPITKTIAADIELMSEGRITLKSVVLGMEIIANCPNKNASIHLVESLFGALEAFFATSLDSIFPYRDRLKIEIEVAQDSSRKTPSHRVDRSGGDLVFRIAHPENYNPVLPEERGEFRDWIIAAILKVMEICTIPSGGPEYFLKLLKDERVLDRALQFCETSIGIDNILGARAKIRLADWAVEPGREQSLLRAEQWFDAKEIGEIRASKETTELKRLKKEDLEKIGHRDRRIVSVIDVPLWNQARWRGTAYFGFKDEEGAPPILGLLFQDEVSGRQIFEGWRYRFGRIDSEEQIRVLFVLGVSKRNPLFYRVSIGTNLDLLDAKNPNQPILIPNRSQTMEPEDTTKRELFFDQYRKVGKFLLVPAFGTPESFRPALDLAIGKTQLAVRNAWELGLEDPDVMALRAGDDPIIPDGVKDAPVVAALKMMRGKS